MLEVYQAYGNYESMMDLTEQIIVDAIATLGDSHRLAWGDQEIDFTRPFQRKRYDDLLAEHAGIDPHDDEAIASRARQADIPTEGRHRDVIKNDLFESQVEDRLRGPVFVIDYPASICPLTKRKSGQQDVAERFELFVEGDGNSQRLHRIERS